MLTVQEVLSATDKDLPGKGMFTSFKVKLESGELAELFQRKDSVPPKPGDQIDGTLEQSQYGLKIRKVAKIGGSGPRQRDPKETAAIQRQHSQSVAVEFLKAKIQAGAMEGFPSTDQLRQLIDWFQRDIEWGVRLAEAPGYGQEQKAKTPPKKPAPASDVPTAGEGEFVHEPQDMSGTPWSTE
jgi:hypothetical protein